MPTLNRLCETSACGRIAIQGSSYCAACKAKSVARRKARQEEIDRQRPSPQRRGYDHAWRKLRDRYIREHPLCVECGARAEQVDHIVPISKGGKRLDPSNLASMCRSCHSRKTVNENRGERGDFGRVMW